MKNLAAGDTILTDIEPNGLSATAEVLARLDATLRGYTPRLQGAPPTISLGLLPQLALPETRTWRRRHSTGDRESMAMSDIFV